MKLSRMIGIVMLSRANCFDLNQAKETSKVRRCFVKSDQCASSEYSALEMLKRCHHENPFFHTPDIELARSVYNAEVKAENNDKKQDACQKLYG